jgi:hypothetical protein
LTYWGYKGLKQGLVFDLLNTFGIILEGFQSFAGSRSRRAGLLRHPGRGERVSGSSQKTGILENILEQLSSLGVSSGMPTFYTVGVRETRR